MTPKYVFSRKELEHCYFNISKKMNGVMICYSLKANAEKEILQILNDIDANFEIASVGEFDILKELNVSSDRIICGLPIKPINWLRYMYSKGCLYYVFDNINELEKLIRYAPSAKKILRINISDLVLSSIDFGMNYREVCSLLSKDSEMKDYVDGLSFHISNNVDICNFNIVMDRIESLLPLFMLKKVLLNIGGGYRLSKTDEFFDNVNMRISKLKNMYNIDVIAEPGNAIVNSSGRIYTSVIGLKKRDAYTDVYIDAGKPSGIKTDNKRIPSNIRIIGKSRCYEEYTYRFIDITCMNKPHFSMSLEYIIEEGDVLEFTDMGAYTVCLQNKFHLWKPPYIEIIT